MNHGAHAFLVSLLCVGVGVGACNAQLNIHDTKEAKAQPCINCHSAAYVQVKVPPHEGIKPVTCNDCHSTNAWVPTTGAGGHPDDIFPILSGKHFNPGIACGDCHIAAMGSSTAGQNTDCIHCHIGAHTIATVDALHGSVSGYMPANPATPHSCLDCHPAGIK